MTLVCTSGPAAEPVTLTEAKAHCRVDTTDDDTLLANLIKVARVHVETICRPRRALITQTWKLVLDAFPAGDTIEIPVVPLASVTGVTYTDEDNITATFASSNYVLDTYSEPARLRLKSDASWPSVTLAALNGFVVTFQAGYGAASTAVPEPFRQAMLLLIGHWYENREAVATSGAVPKALEFAVESLLAPYRMEVG